MAQLKDLLVEGKSRFIDKIYASDQFISKVVQGTSPFLVDSSTLVSNLNADLVDGQHFTYSNTNNTPTYLWGTSSNGTNYLVSRASMHSGIADKVSTIASTATGNFYLTFVDSNNTPNAAEETLYTSAKLYIQPSTGNIVTSGYIAVGPGKTYTYIGSDSDGVVWIHNSSGYPIVCDGVVVRRSTSLTTASLGSSSVPWPTVYGTNIYTRYIEVDSSATGATAHIKFNRANFNYLQIPTGGTFAVSINGASGAATYLAADASATYPGYHNKTVDLGTSSYSWKDLYIVSLQLPNNAILEDASGRVGIGTKPAHSSAKGLNVGDLLVSNAWADRSKVPTNGIYSKGQIKSGVAHGTAPLIVDSSTVVSNLNSDYLDGLHATEFVEKRYGRFYPFIAADPSRSIWHKVTFPHTGYTSSSNAWFMLSMEIVLGGVYTSATTGKIFLSYYFLKNSSNVWTASNVKGIAIGTHITSSGITIKYDIANPAIFYIKVSPGNYTSFAIENLSANDTAQNFDYRNTTIEAIAEADIPSTATNVVPIASIETTDGSTLTASNLTATIANKVKTVSTSTNASHYLTFVDSNNSPAAEESLYTSSKIAFNPYNGFLGLGTTSPATTLHVKSDGNTSAATQVSIENATFAQTTYCRAVDATAAAMVKDSRMVYMIGKAGTNSNKAYFGYHHIADGCTNNFATIGLHSHDELLNVLASGNVGVGTTAPSHKLDVNGVAAVYPRGEDNTLFRGSLIIKQQNSVEGSNGAWDETKPSFGIQFNRFWTSGGSPYGETPCAGIFATVSSSWRGGLVFRTKNNTTNGGTHDISALTLAPSGIAKLHGRTDTANYGYSSPTPANSAFQIREYNYGGAQTDTWGYAPRMSWLWDGRNVNAQIGLASNGYLYWSNDNFGTNKYKLMYENGTWEISITGNAATATSADLLDNEHTHQIRRLTQRTSYELFDLNPTLEDASVTSYLTDAGTREISPMPTDASGNVSPSAWAYRFDVYKSFYTPYIPVQPGRSIRAEVKVLRMTGADTDKTAGTLYVRLYKYGKNKERIAATTYESCGASGTTVPCDSLWHTYGKTFTVAATGDPYDASGYVGDGVRYIRINILVNYSKGTIPTYIGGIKVYYTDVKANEVQTIASTATGNHYLTFVDSNNSTADTEILYTTAKTTIQPSTGNIVTQGYVAIGTGRANSYLGSDSASNIWLHNSSGYPLVCDGNVIRRGTAMTNAQLGTSSYPWPEIYGTKFKTANYELSESTNSRLSVGNAGQSVAKGLNVGDLLVSSAWADYTKVPTNGIYSKGQVKIGVAQGTAPLVVDSSTQVTNLKSNFAQYADVLRDPVYYRYVSSDLTSGRRTSANISWADGGLHYYLATSSMTTGKPAGDAHILHMSWDNSKYEGQLAVPTGESRSIEWRVQLNNDASWSPWKTVLDSSNYETYAAAKTHNHDSSYVKLSSTEQTIESTISSYAKGVIEFYRSSGDHICFISFANKVSGAKRTLGAIGFYSGGTGKLQYRDVSANYYNILHAGNTSAASVTLSTTDQTFVTVNGTAYKIKLPATIPWTVSTTDKYVEQSESTTANYRGVVLGYNNNASANTGITTTVTNVVYTTNNLTVQPSTGNIVTKGYVAVGTGGVNSYIASDAANNIYLHNSSGAVLVATGKVVRRSTSLADVSLGDASYPWAGVYAKQFISKIAQGTAPILVDSSTLVSNLNADLLDGLHESAFARKIVAGTTVAMANSGGTITVETNKIILVTTTSTSAVTFNFTWNSPAVCDEAHVIITGSGSSKTITIGNVNSDSTNTKKNVAAIKVTSGGYGEISIVYFDSKYFIRAVGN